MTSYTDRIKKHYTEMTPVQNSAIYSWQQTANYGKISKFLREHPNKNLLSKTDKNRIKNAIPVIRRVINNSPLSNKNITVYRGYPATLINPEILNVTNRSFLATTTNIKEAKKYGNVVVRITLPRTLKRHIMKNSREGEILIENGTRLVNIKQEGFLNNGKKALYSARLEKYTPSPVIKPTNNNTRRQAALRNNAMKKLLANENEINWTNI
jgi:hypothetical protein